MDPLHLRVLREVARRGSISAAADALGYTPPAVSRHLMLLERQTAHALVDRTPRGARLTPAGHTLLEHAERILAGIEEARAAMSRFGAADDAVRVAAPKAAITSFVPAAARRVRAREPRVQVSFEVHDTVPALESLRAGLADVAITNAAALDGPDPRLDTRLLAEDPLLCVLPADHPLAACEEVEIARLATEPWVLASRPGCPMDRLVRSACRRHGFVPDVRYDSGDHDVAFGLVAGGLAVTVVPRLAAPRHGADVVLRPFAEPLAIELATVVDARAPASPARDLVRAELHAAAARHVREAAPVAAATIPASTPAPVRVARVGGAAELTAA